jgi:peptidyl-prolyl cis-trans isomerase B (cyclophilin B)
MKRLVTFILLILLTVTLLIGCNEKVDQLTGPRVGDNVAVIVVRDYGNIYIRLFDKEAPKAVENFITHAKEGYYDNVPFYRIIEDSMIESGDPTGTGSGGESIWGDPFKDEFNSELQPYYGALCMANTGPDTNASRFFLIQSAETFDDSVLNQIEQSYQIEFNKNARMNYSKIGGAPWFYRLNTVFGQIYRGFNVMDEIAKAKKTDDEQGIPAEEIMIEKITIQRHLYYQGNDTP